MKKSALTRRAFVGAGGAALVAAAAAQAAPKPAAAKPPAAPDDDVPPTEDLMREHGVLRRLLLVYEESQRRLDTHAEVNSDVLQQAAGIVRHFVEDYHERDEEQFIFPRLEKAGQQLELIATLRRQHQAGRKLTDDVMRLATPAQLKLDPARAQLSTTLALFSRMYRPHAAREDTVLFPAFRVLVPARELRQLQDVFEAKEQALPTGNFEKMVLVVGQLEEALHIADLNRFTPPM